MRESRLCLNSRCGALDALRVCAFAVEVLAGLSAFISTSAQAGAWIPAPGHGYFEPMLRFSTANRSFPSGSFSTSTTPSSKRRTNQIRITGEHGLGQRFSLDYDLRFAYETRSKTKKGITTSTDLSGLEDGRIGLNYGVLQFKHFAEAVGLGVVFPGTSIDATSPLSGGHWALEPIYRLGFKPDFWNLTINLDVASRVFLNGGAVQFRTNLEVNVPVFHGVSLIGKLFFVRSVRMNGYNDLRDRGERYDLLRLGVGTQFRLTKYIRPAVVYEPDIAGMSQHASQRFTIGVKFKY